MACYYSQWFEKSGAMSGEGSKPRDGKMGISIRATSVSVEAVANADQLNCIHKELLMLWDDTRPLKR